MLSAKRLDEEDSARALEVIYKSARAQNQLISDLLDVSRIITGKLRLEVSMVELIPIIEAAMDRAPRGRRQEDPARLIARSGGGAGVGRPRPLAAGRLEPPVQRRQVHARGRADRGPS